MNLRLLTALVSSFAALGLATGCTTMGRIENLTDPTCRGGFAMAVSTILVGQGEKPEVADNLADHQVEVLGLVDLGPHPFFVSSPSGTDYTFFVQFKKGKCLLRLYGRQRGFWSYTNNLTYIATQPLPTCLCSK